MLPRQSKATSSLSVRTHILAILSHTDELEEKKEKKEEEEEEEDDDEEEEEDEEEEDEEKKVLRIVQL